MSGSAARRLPVSVIITNHNYGSFLGQAIDSALRQSHPVAEVVVVDDGSIDDSARVIGRYGQQIRSLMLPTAGGQTAALNQGFAHSHGELVVFLDADDYLLPTAIEDGVALLQGSDAVKCHWPMQVVDASGARTGETVPAGVLADGNVRSTLLEEGPDAIAFPPTSGSLWRREFLEQVLPLPAFEAELGIGSASADALLSWLATIYGPVRASARAGGCYRVHGSNDFAGLDLTRRTRRQVDVLDRQFEVIARHAKEHGLDADVARWRTISWFHRLDRAFDAVERHVDPGGALLLADLDQWGVRSLDGRRVIPFSFSATGEYAGLPAHTGDAVSTIARAADLGATHVAVGWPAFWWLEHYEGLADYLLSQHERVFASDDVVIVALTHPVPPLRRRRRSAVVGAVLARKPLAPEQERDRDDLVAQLATRYREVLRPLLADWETCALVDFPDHPNVGDSAIWLGQRLALARLGVRVTYACSRLSYDPDTLRRTRGPILIQGGGNLGDLWPMHQQFRELVVTDFPDRPIVQLPQTVNFQSEEAADEARRVLDAHPQLTILVRDRSSHELARRLFDVPVELSPDAAFQLGPLTLPARPRAEVVHLLRQDVESANPAHEPLGALRLDWGVEDQPPGGTKRALSGWPGVLGELSGASFAALDEQARRRLLRGCSVLAAGQRVVTDRLHGHILCLLLGIPHTVVDDKHGKVRSFRELWTRQALIGEDGTL